MRWAVLCLCLAGAAAAAAQEAAGSGGKAAPPIQDNSFLVEEAYNQEEGVVQHINFFQRNARTGEWIATFTQEYPVPRIRHQLSYTAAYQRVEGPDGKASGLGDVALNYRYQLVGDGEANVAVAPRVSVFLPAGDERRGLGTGSTGVQVAIPVSTVLSSRWIAHWNAGGTVTPSARNDRGDKAQTLGYYGAASVIWLGSSFNGMLESVWSYSQNVVGPHKTAGATSFLVSPGVRWSYDFPSGLQIVPGVGFPIGLGSSRGQRSILLYLSFEHPFREVRKAP